jgi:hypothetical protein
VVSCVSDGTPGFSWKDDNHCRPQLRLVQWPPFFDLCVMEGRAWNISDWITSAGRGLPKSPCKATVTKSPLLKSSFWCPR